MDRRVDTSPSVPRCTPAHMMRLARHGSFHQSRLSFKRILTRRMKREGWTFARPVFDLDAGGVGHAVYSDHTPIRINSLVAFAHDLPAKKRSDRVIAEAWNCTFTLFDGAPTDADIKRLRANVPYQEAGRITGSELSLSGAIRSVRLWEYLVSCLAEGRQPEQAEVMNVGHLMRTPAVYGSGKSGAADRESIAARPEGNAPFQIEMLSVCPPRTFSRDLTAQMADTNTDGFRIDGAMPIGAVQQILAQVYDRALGVDRTAKDSCARVFYASEEKLEPRLGERFDEPIAAYEHPLAPGRDAAALHAALGAWDAGKPVAEFLLTHPEHRHAVRRAQIAARASYAEIRDNTIGSDLRPIDMLRCKLSFFGALHLDPEANRWVRICMFGAVPYPEELASSDTDFWPYPVPV